MKLIVNGLATEYKDEGQGPVLLLLPGWMNTISNFDELASHLTENFRVVRLDFPGFGGGTESPPPTWRVLDYASFVKAFIEKIGLTSYVLIGHSFGGRVIIKGVSHGMLHPERVILVASAGVARSRTFRNRIFTILAKIGKIITYVPPFSLWRTQLRKKLYGRLKSDYLAAGPLSQVYLNTIREDQTEAARKIAVPTLLIWGTADDMVPLSDAHLLSERIQGSRLEVFEGVGHSPHRDRPKEVAELIKKFV
ncbi:alpha/beta hydrolase [Candidatus Parcubacteria bacterium]|nr:MAG: alpha/beta hydrolase [Candidatus Parcubacteria bacterium]